MTESFLELTPRERLAALLNPAFTELLDPFCRLASPWLERQGLIPQANDGVIVVRGTHRGRALVAIAIEPAFEGGSIGEVGGAKIATALQLAAASRLPALLLLESGGVRLGEANLGLAAIAEIQSAIVALRTLAPVVAVIAGPTGCFGGMSLAASLCTAIIGTAHGRLGMNGPEVIEQEAGPQELDATDRRQIWRMVGCEARLHQGFLDTLAHDSAPSLSVAIAQALAAGPQPIHRLANPAARLQSLRQAFPAALPQPMVESPGRHWIDLLSRHTAAPVLGTPSLLCAEAPIGPESALLLAVVPDPTSRLPRAAHGEMGLEQAWTLAACLRAWLAEQATNPIKRPILAIVDTPGQAFGRREEELCISAACAAAVEAYAEARRAGHPILALVVGKAISGSFLAHGLQAHTILALHSPAVLMHAMSQESIARITRRTVAEVQAASAAVAPMSYDIAQAHALGIVSQLLPAESTLDQVQSALAEALRNIRAATLPDPIATNPTRAATQAVRTLMQAQWLALGVNFQSHERELDAVHH